MPHEERKSPNDVCVYGNLTHVPVTLKYADKLVVLDDGKVAEIGSHGELMVKGGVYSRLVTMQSKLSAIRAVDG